MVSSIFFPLIPQPAAGKIKEHILQGRGLYLQRLKLDAACGSCLENVGEYVTLLLHRKDNVAVRLADVLYLEIAP